MKTGVTTTAEFYKDLGFGDYRALDINQHMDAVICDLNYPVKVNDIGQAELVTDNGTGEHLFNQYTVWNNHHKLTKLNGVMIKVMPFKDWINHGFFNFNPIIYRDVAAANNYRWLFFWICDRVHDPIDQDFSNDAPFFIEKRPKELIDFAGRPWQTDIYLVAAWQKIVEQSFEIPLQGKYKKDIDDAQLKLNYDP